MVKVYARLCEMGSYNFYTDVENNKAASVRKLAPKVREQIEADGYIINADGTCTPAFGTLALNEEA